MTSTPFNVGLSDNKRLSSRVLRPPGGAHTDIFGAEPEPLKTRRHIPSGSVHVSTIGVDIRAPTNGTESHEQNGQASSEAAPPPETASTNNADNTGVNENPAKTEAPVAAQQPANAPAKRVRVPPGGFSSRLW
ncbi:uncharacterized protein LOC126380489 [Pectinophora gossypiella]|nr:uncharacterized protein LOC126380489 [Pectinophora gossypiella]